MSYYKVSDLASKFRDLPPDVAKLYNEFEEATEYFTLDMQEYANACSDAGVPVDFLQQEDELLTQLIELYPQPPTSPTPTNRTQLENLIASTQLAINYETDAMMRQRLEKLIENTKLAITYL